MSDALTQDEMRAELKRQVDAAGGLMVWCRVHGFTHPSVSAAIRGERDVSESMANACGFLAQMTFKPMRGAA